MEFSFFSGRHFLTESTQLKPDTLYGTEPSHSFIQLSSGKPHPTSYPEHALQRSAQAGRQATANSWRLTATKKNKQLFDISL